MVGTPGKGGLQIGWVVERDGGDIVETRVRIATPKFFAGSTRYRSK